MNRFLKVADLHMEQNQDCLTKLVGLQLEHLEREVKGGYGAAHQPSARRAAAAVTAMAGQTAKPEVRVSCRAVARAQEAPLRRLRM